MWHATDDDDALVALIIYIKSWFLYNPAIPAWLLYIHSIIIYNQHICIYACWAADTPGHPACRFLQPAQPHSPGHPPPKKGGKQTQRAASPRRAAPFRSSLKGS
mmetsp:Transcript_17832/g.26919  ORF Transcript_17832/g.26919 Transcript_17832/m.26919 type:complete len:104 (-) Transcript_17832:33-344(-)